jgi:hypothetical protein
MDRLPITSSNIISVGYDTKSRIPEIEFDDGSVYQYSNVPENIYGGLMSARSHGRYFDAYIKKGDFKYQQIK